MAAGESESDGLWTADAEIEELIVFGEDARIVVHSDEGESVMSPPGTRRFSGRLSGMPESTVFLSVQTDGTTRGLIVAEGKIWVVSREPGDEGERPMRQMSSRVLSDPSRAFRCDNEGVLFSGSEAVFGQQGDTPTSTAAPRLKAASYTARVAVETDHEFWLLFGDSAAATDYVGDVIGYASTIYRDETDTTLEVVHLSLWTTSSDPWTQNSTLCLLAQFGKYWNDNRTGVTRTIAHYMSGKSVGGGVAWVGVLCGGAFTYDISEWGCSGLPSVSNYGGGYGFTGNLSGNFDPNNPVPMWDIIAVSHEIGHNFNSPHTHCYKNIGGNALPVDECYGAESGSRCYSGTGHLPCSTSGSGCGTLMSYCHLLGGGYNNISLTFGAGHPWGVEPQRVPDRMNDHVVSRAAAYAGCLDYFETGEIFKNGFEPTDDPWSDNHP